MAKSFWVYLDENLHFTKEEIASIVSAVAPPEGWDRDTAGIYVYAANLYDPHNDMFAYFGRLSDYLNDNGIERHMKVRFSWGTGGDYEVYDISKDSVVYDRNEGYDRGELVVAPEDITGLPDDFELIPYSTKVEQIISRREDGKLTPFRSTVEAK